jgi:hypothetical protein
MARPSSGVLRRYESTRTSMKHFGGSWRLRCKPDRVACLGVRDRSWRRTTLTVESADPASPLGHEQQGPRGPVALGATGPRTFVRGSVPIPRSVAACRRSARPRCVAASHLPKPGEYEPPWWCAETQNRNRGNSGAASLDSCTSSSRTCRFRPQIGPNPRAGSRGFIFARNGPDGRGGRGGRSGRGAPRRSGPILPGYQPPRW